MLATEATTMRKEAAVMRHIGALAAAAMLLAMPARAHANCRTDAAAFQEKLEPVIEAAIDGRPAAQAPAVTRASAWWKERRANFPSPLITDALMSDMAKASRAHETSETARLAYEAAISSWRACPSDPSVSDRVMMIDLGGMAAWLRSQGKRVEVPPELSGSLDAIGKRLEAAKRAALASKLARAGREVLDEAKSKDLARRAATRLLVVVDEVEVALRKAAAPPPKHHGK
jgi:hypothetical protein